RVKIPFYAHKYFKPRVRSSSTFKSFYFNAHKFQFHNVLFSKFISDKNKANGFGTGLRAFVKFRKFQKSQLDSFIKNRGLDSKFSSNISNENLFKLHLSYNKTLNSVDRLKKTVFTSDEILLANEMVNEKGALGAESFSEST